MKTFAALLILLFALGASAQHSSHSVVAGALPQMARPLGPKPGPGDAEPRRQESPYARDPVALMEGRRIFVAMNCAGCHGGHAGGGMGPSLRDPTWIYGGAASEIYDSVAEGRAHGMPAWGTRMPRENIWKVVAYIRSLRKPWEPEPPQ